MNNDRLCSIICRGEEIWTGRFSDWARRHPLHQTEFALAVIEDAASCVAAGKPWPFPEQSDLSLIPETTIAALETKWSPSSPEFPLCAVCDRVIGDTSADDAEDDVAIRLWRKKGTQELAFHCGCFRCVRTI